LGTGWGTFLEKGRKKTAFPIGETKGNDEGLENQFFATMVRTGGKKLSGDGGGAFWGRLYK